MAPRAHPRRTLPKGVCLADETEGHPPRRVAHMQTEEWTITSDVPLDDVLSHAPADVILPGRLGAYVYPSDAVFHLRDPGGAARDTTAEDLASAKTRERRLVPPGAERIGLVHHVTIPAVATEEEDPLAADEEERDDETDDEAEGGGGSEAEPEAEDDGKDEEGKDDGAGKADDDWEDF